MTLTGIMDGIISRKKINNMQLKNVPIILLCICIFAVTLYSGCTKNKPRLEDCALVERQPAIYPDYAEITIPPNIAPTNFIIEEKAERYYVNISSEAGGDIDIFSQSANIKIPVKQWRTLLTNNAGKSLQITVFAQDTNGKWISFSPIENQIASEKIDSHLVYRLMKPLYQFWGKLGIYQRDLTSFNESPIILNSTTGKNCVNCHSFHNYNPDRMMFHMRAGDVGTSMILAYDGEILKVDTSTPFNRATSYRSWHPNGEIIAFAFNVVKQIFHSIGENRDVYDRVSDLCLYNVKTRTITTSPKISSKEHMETYPEWSPDGKYLYFCSAPSLDTFTQDEHPYKQIRYDLMRISYDTENDSWGELETVFKASELGFSVAHPKITPDGKYVLFCMSKYSYFPLYRPESDLWLLNIQSKAIRKADKLNSNRAESYHCWSSNGCWVVFSSKRQDGISTHLYLSYFDANGNFSKPFLLPQEDQEYHRSRVIVYNVPEFVNGPVKIRPQKIIQTAWSDQITKTRLDPKVSERLDNQIEDTTYMPSPRN